MVFASDERVRFGAECAEGGKATQEACPQDGARLGLQRQLGMRGEEATAGGEEKRQRKRASDIDDQRRQREGMLPARPPCLPPAPLPAAPSSHQLLFPEAVAVVVVVIIQCFVRAKRLIEPAQVERIQYIGDGRAHCADRAGHWRGG